MYDLREIFEVRPKLSKKQSELIARAYNAALKAHEGQKRMNGDPYFSHVFAAGKKVAEIGMDAETIAAAFLHDTLEDNRLSATDLKKQFGDEVFFLVDGLTKLGKLRYQGLKRHAESLRKFFIATSKDVRVLIIRLADRLHNVKTLSGIPVPEKRRRIAVETLEIFAPLANRLGMGELKSELEEYAFPHANPEAYAAVKKIVKEHTNVADQQHIEKFRKSLQKELAAKGITAIKTEYRVKKLYSLYKKLQKKGMDIDKVNDLLAVRVIVPTVADCYRALGTIHEAWKPLPGRIKDYIALPKPNGYQSLHSTLLVGDGSIVEVQIKTPEMHHEAAYGIASHLSYKESGTLQEKKKFERELPWVKQFLEWHKHFSEEGEFLEFLKTDLFKDRVFVFTRDGDVIDLPEHATPIDFAYQIHTDVGDHTVGARVNKKLVSLETELKNGDIVEILTKKTAKPSRKWIDYARTPFAKKQIRASVKDAR